MARPKAAKGAGTDWREAARGFSISDATPVPIHHQVCLALAQLLERGVWNPGDQIPGERDLAAQFGISPLTANKSITALVRQGRLERQRGRGTFVAHPARTTELRLAIVLHCSLAVATKGYYYEGLMRGIRATLAPLGFEHSISFIDEWHPEVLAGMPRERLSGILVMAPSAARWNDIENLWRFGIPTVALGASWPGANVPTVDSDNVSGMRALMQYLFDLGHTRIGSVFSTGNYSNHRDRHETYLQFLKQHGLPLREDWLIAWRAFEREPDEDVEKRLRRFLNAPDRPTAVVTVDYDVAATLLRLAREEGLQIPGDLSIAGFDDPFSAACLNPPLTTVAQPLEEMGVVATEKLVALCQGVKEAAKPETLPTQLVVRASCAPPKR